MNSLPGLQGLDLDLPSPAYLFGAIVFGIVGWGAFRYGKRLERPITKWLGIALMVYPYAISRTWLLYAIGVALCAGFLIERN